MDLCQSRWEKKAHADDKLCNYSGSIFALLACSQELQWLIKQSKETPLTEVCIPRFSLIWEGDCLVLHSLMPSHLARADMNQQVHRMISKAVKTSFWNQILKQHSIAAFSSRARLLSASLGFFFFVLCTSNQSGCVLRSLGSRSLRKGLAYDLMFHRSRWHVCCICRRQNCQCTLLKPSIATGIKGLTPSTALRMKKTWTHFTTSSVQHKLGRFKRLFSQALIRAFLFSGAPDFLTFVMRVITKATCPHGFQDVPPLCFHVGTLLC